MADISPSSVTLRTVGPISDAQAYRRAMWAARRWLWQHSQGDAEKRLWKCGRFAIDGAETHLTRSNETGRCSYIGLFRCGSVWACPSCATVKALERSAEISRAVERWKERPNHEVLLLTLTMRHGRGDPLARVWDAFSTRRGGAGGFSAVWGSRKAARMRETIGADHYIASTEVTHGLNGWHVHRHVLVFCSKPVSVVHLNTFRGILFASWAAWLKRNEYPAPSQARAVDIRKITTAAEAAAYVTKVGFSSEGWSIAREMTGAASKEARSGNRSPFEILGELVSGVARPRDRALWTEWVKASHGRRAIVWSKGLRAELCLTHTKKQEINGEIEAVLWEDPETLLEPAPAVDRVSVAVVPRELRERLLTPNSTAGPRLLEAVESGGVAAGVAFCEAEGLPPLIPLPLAYSPSTCAPFADARPPPPETAPAWYLETFPPDPPAAVHLFNDDKPPTRRPSHSAIGL